jgi:fructose-1,6-bisphosphatase I
MHQPSTQTEQFSSQSDSHYYNQIPIVQSSSNRITLARYLDSVVKENPDLRDLESLLLGLQMACKTISNLVHRAGLVWDLYAPNATQGSTGSRASSRSIDATESKLTDDYPDGRFYSMKRLDALSTLVLKNALKYTGKCEVVAPEARLDSESPAQHQPGVLIARSLDATGENVTTAVLDPLDGSGNADASICTGTVFGVFTGPPAKAEESEDRTEELVRSVLQPGHNMRAAGYCLYSSATVLVFSLGDMVQGFTLDPQLNEFVLTHPNLTIPARGTVYSCNEANSEGWDDKFKSYLRDLKTGQGQTRQRYAHRYVGSMVGDIHRTLLYGGLFCYPADNQTHPDGNLQLLYKTAPMAYVVERAGGRCIDGRTGSLLHVQPARVHQKSPCFLGSPDDISELETYLNQ